MGKNLFERIPPRFESAGLSPQRIDRLARLGGRTLADAELLLCAAPPLLGRFQVQLPFPERLGNILL
jgi:hypothetical protein